LPAEKNRILPSETCLEAAMRIMRLRSKGNASEAFGEMT